MSYSRIKVWIAAEILTASDLNSEHNGHISNENDLDTRLIAEVSTRSALETDYNTFYGACWNAGSSEIAANRVSKTSMKDDAIGLAEIEAAATDPAAGVGGLRTLGTTAVKACAGNDSRLSNERTPSDGSVTATKLASTVAGAHTIKTVQTAEYCHNSTSYTKITEIRLGLSGAIRTKFHLRRYDQDGTAYGRLYKNGVAVGTARSNTSTSGVYYEEDLSGFVSGDLLQLYTKHSTSGGQVCAKELSLSVAVPFDNVATLES